MFKAKSIVISICSAFAIAGCASLEQFKNQTVQTLGLPHSRQAEKSADELYGAGREYQAQVQYDRAIEAYLQALDRDHTMADAHNALGVVYAMVGRYDDAVVELKAAIELKPGRAYLHSNLGYALMLKGANWEALSPLEIALQLDPDNEKAAFNLRLAHERLGDLPRPVKISANSESKPLQAPPAETKAVDPRLVAVGPGIYELSLPARAEDDVVPLRAAAVAEGTLSEQPVRTARRFRLEVSNGNGTPGLARQVARMLDRGGVHANRVTNHATFREATTQIQYRPGYLSEATVLRDMFPARVTAVSDSSLRKDIQVRILLGKDAASVAKAAHQSYALAPAEQATPVASK
jgi:tetratricopeptide (TPR) repeat protein